MNLRAVLNTRAMRVAVTALVVAIALVLWTLTRFNSVMHLRRSCTSATRSVSGSSKRSSGARSCW
jgi:hypothetical protein